MPNPRISRSPGESARPDRANAIAAEIDALADTPEARAWAAAQPRIDDETCRAVIAIFTTARNRPRPEPVTPSERPSHAT
jgi:hypothetical protein